ncbi:MAG: hypothetical protein A4E20_01480 [Nitrospira sp. SG-bin2]|uniref:hypothetical protein n=1 Tax=Nitrospira cf. moscoviensis SBR1015 TaxID=96242 RepID=UPI000A0E6CC5|nr:hypothetical protein [Nitrospira cf. moscoviensis SBR1015]OQW34876.1 MAG: hypothetical protein A4E20_01480 [Nitrospira sp. SG-bin2]
MAEPKIRICTDVNGMWVRQLLFEQVGDTHRGHYHSEDHATLLTYGSLSINVDGVGHTYTAPHIIVITKGKRHDLTALEPGTLAYCVAPVADVPTFYPPKETT